MHETLQATSEPGRRFVALMEEHARSFAARAAKHDREGSFPFENFEELRRSGAMAAMVPERLGGMGVPSLSDMIAGVARLGGGDASTAIGANMHIATGLVLRMDWEAADAAGDHAARDRAETLLREMGRGEITFCLLGSEAGTDQLHPQVRATRTEGGYLINGRKIFGTLSPGANRFYVFATVETEDGGLEIAGTLLPRDTPGMEIQDNWDGMGMRASGSNDVVFTDCFVEDTHFGTVRQAYGAWSRPWFNMIIIENLGLASVFYGIADAARTYAVDQVRTRRKKPSNRTLAERPTIQHWIAENEIDLTSARFALEGCARRVDEFHRANPPGSDVSIDTWHQLNKLFQVTKNIVTGRAVAVVDRAMTATGGSGYHNSSPLSRWYRDVRAGPIMQTYSPNEQYEYIAKATLGLPMEMTV